MSKHLCDSDIGVLMKSSTIFLVSIFSLTIVSAYSVTLGDSSVDTQGENVPAWSKAQEVYNLLRATNELFKKSQVDNNNSLFQDAMTLNDDEDGVYEKVTEVTQKLFNNKEKIDFLLTAVSEQGNEDSKAHPSYVKTRKNVGRYLGVNAPKSEEVKKAEQFINSLAIYFVPSEKVKGYSEGVTPHKESILDPTYIALKMKGLLPDVTESYQYCIKKMPQWAQESRIVKGLDPESLKQGSLTSYIFSPEKIIPADFVWKNIFNCSGDNPEDEKVSRQAEVEAIFYANKGEATLFAFGMLNTLIEGMEASDIELSLADE